MAVTRSNDGESRARGAAIQHAGEQGLLFGDEALAVHSDDVGYRGPTACAAAGITYRQLDYWARTGAGRARASGRPMGRGRSAFTASATSAC